MAFIRVKNIGGKPYAYLVETITTTQGPRQKVKQYLGRVHELEARDTPRDILERDLSTIKSKNVFLGRMILAELGGTNHSEIAPEFSRKDLSVTHKNKDAILKLNDGFLCAFTIRQLLCFKKSGDVECDARLLAKYFVDAGLLVSEEEFVRYYQLL